MEIWKIVEGIKIPSLCAGFLLCPSLAFISLLCIFIPFKYGRLRAACEKTLFIGFIFVMALIVLVFIPTHAHAANPADLTSMQRMMPTEMYMVALHDGGYKWFWANEPIGSDRNVSLYTESNDKTGDRNVEVFLSKRFDKKVDVSLDVELEENPNKVISRVFVDVPKRWGGLNVALPLSSRAETKIGGRWKWEDFTFFAYCSLESDRNERIGITHQGYFTTEVAHRSDNGKSYLRIAKGFPTKFGTIIPGIRFENVGGKTSTGFSFLFIP